MPLLKLLVSVLNCWLVRGYYSRPHTSSNKCDFIVTSQSGIPEPTVYCETDTQYLDAENNPSIVAVNTTTYNSKVYQCYNDYPNTMIEYLYNGDDNCRANVSSLDSIIVYTNDINDSKSNIDTNALIRTAIGDQNNTNVTVTFSDAIVSINCGYNSECRMLRFELEYYDTSAVISENIATRVCFRDEDSFPDKDYYSIYVCNDTSLWKEVFKNRKCKEAFYVGWVAVSFPAANATKWECSHPVSHHRYRWTKSDTIEAIVIGICGCIIFSLITFVCTRRQPTADERREMEKEKAEKKLQKQKAKQESKLNQKIFRYRQREYETVEFSKNSDGGGGGDGDDNDAVELALGRGSMSRSADDSDVDHDRPLYSTLPRKEELPHIR